MQHWIKSVFVALLSVSLAAGESASSGNAAVTPRRAEETFEWDLTDFSVRFERCQYVKAYDDELAEAEGSETVLAMKHFVVYKLCPSDSCGSCDGVHGEYVTDVDDFLAATVEYQKEALEYECENCNERCNDNGEYCDGCGQLCYQYDNLEANGYVDASNYIQCQQVNGGDDDNDGGNAIYIGPKCSKTQNEIVIGLFTDAYCLEPYYDKDVEDVIGAKLSYYILANIQSSDGSVCLSCAENADNQNQNDANDYDNVNEMCEELYASSGKCESKYGLEGGFIQTNYDNGNYENQVENEFMVCTYINSLIWNSYTETGEINIVDDQDEIIREITTLQKVSLSAVTISLVSLAAYALYLTNRIEKASPPKVDLSAQTDKEVI